MSEAGKQSLAAGVRAARAARRRQWEDTLLVVLRAAGVPAPLREYSFAKPRRFRFDFAWLKQKVAVEVDGGGWVGGRHGRGRGMETDARKYSLAAALGWRILRVTPSMIESREAVRLLEAALGGVRGDATLLLEDGPAQRSAWRSRARGGRPR